MTEIRQKQIPYRRPSCTRSIPQRQAACCFLEAMVLERRVSEII